MERRFLIAIALMAVVALLPTVLWPPKPAVKRTGGQADSTAASVTAPVQAAAPAQAPPSRPADHLTATTVPPETVWVTTPLYKLGFSTQGAQLVQAQLADYRSFAAGDSGRRAQIIPAGRPLLVHQLVVGADTVSLGDWQFTPSAKAVQVRGLSAPLTFTAAVKGVRVTIVYTFTPAEYRFQVRGQVTGLGPQGAVLVVGLGDGLRPVEADVADDARHYSVVTKATKTEREDFYSLKTGQVAVLDGPFEWVGVKSKYFFAAALALTENQPQFGGAVVVGGPRTPVPTRSLFFGTRLSATALQASVALTLPVPPSGDFRYDFYAGPLEYRRLAALGHDLDDANPYGWIFRPIVKPVARFVVGILLWAHDHLSLAYGWVLIMFGVFIRLLLWPLNQRAMESQMRMAAVAPLIQDTQARLKDDPEKLQKEMMRLYKEHNVNPLGGCLPMLLPWPVLLALFFVFSNTIELRGAPFLWLPDLSRADPFFALPIVMGLSMYVLSKVGQMGVPPNPQAKTMTTLMPVMMTVVFLRLASGLNLYYLVSNLASIPQQYAIARKRLRKQGKV